jgi:uncharacterized protein (DUF1800 family)
MKIFTLRFLYFSLVVCTSLVLSSFFIKSAAPGQFPYKEKGLTTKQAAAHLLSRFSYGPKSGDIDRVADMGLEKWFKQQIETRQSDPQLDAMLSGYDAIHLSNAEVKDKYLQANEAFKLAQSQGLFKRDLIDKTDKKEYRDKVEAYMRENGLRPQQELFRQFVNQKILRATYTNNQLQELLTDFWFNHFNVSLGKNQCAEFIPAYERDVIRPNVFGKFENLVLATAKSPAMLMYLDNFSSMANETEMAEMQNPQQRKRLAAQLQMGDSSKLAKAIQQRKKTRGLNENYAREVMELHTLGVDGGYTQQDVTQAARILTGWTVYPLGDKGYGSAMKGIVSRLGEDEFKKRGFVRDGDFLFAANRHDKGEKVVLGRKFPAGGGYEEGVELLKMLARHPSTAKFISRKLAVRFVSDNPPQALIDKMAKTFLDKNGDIKQVLITMVSSPEFWSKDALREKTKSPFELAISAARSLDADIKAPYQLYSWITKMGQKLYYYQAPTGFPDNGQYWINTGSLLNRMNFGLALASQRIPGVKVDLAAINDHKEPESAEAALLVYSKIIMPERDLSATVKRLTPMLNDPRLISKVEDAASKANPKMEDLAEEEEDMMMVQGGKKGKGKAQFKNIAANGDNSMLAQVVGVIIGSPEFQRK